MTPQEQQLFDSQEVKVWTLNIPFKSTTLRKRAKELGAKWNQSNKVWTVECKECELVWEELDQCIVKNNQKDNKSVNYGTGCITTRENAMRYGYDAIER